MGVKGGKASYLAPGSGTGPVALGCEMNELIWGAASCETCVAGNCGTTGPVAFVMGVNGGSGVVAEPVPKGCVGRSIGTACDWDAAGGTFFFSSGIFCSLPVPALASSAGATIFSSGVVTVFAWAGASFCGSLSGAGNKCFGSDWLV